MHYYRYLHDGRIIASDTPRPDLLAWAYWSEISEAEVPHEHVHFAAPAEPEPVAKPATKAPTRRPRTRKE
ncbi:hypothetical protein [Nocardia otitidiscaviarum]|uniref:hypothetical protein n=1 Tax=Nocardia otitidiscaviarum TaxID=1823 RepID=UPI00245605CA|nr:hypothetical protein [Nocardia otitidiscaviarum]